MGMKLRTEQAPLAIGKLSIFQGH